MIEDKKGFTLRKKLKKSRIKYIILCSHLVLLLPIIIVLAPYKVMAELSATSYIYTINTAAGTGAWGYSGDGGVATSAKLNNPGSIAVDNEGNIYIADTYNHRIRKVDSTGVISTIAGTGSRGYSGDGGFATAAQLNYPYCIAVDNTGNMYISDNANSRIRFVDKDTGMISTIAGTGINGYSGDGGVATAAQLSNSNGVALDLVGNIYISSRGGIRMIEKTTGIITTIAGNGTYGCSGDGGAATSAQLDIDGLAVDSLGNVYIADSSNNRIRKIDKSTGVITTIAGGGGSGIPGFSGDGGVATSAQLRQPKGVAADSIGNVYIADYYNNRIRLIDKTTGIISTIAGTGTSGFSGDGGPAAAAELFYPSGITVDTTGNIFFIDFNNKRIRTIKKMLASPGLIAITTNNIIGQSVNISFPDDLTWREAVSGIAVDGTVLNPSQYSISSGSINISAKVFTTVGNHTIVVKATGYCDASVIHTISLPSAAPLLLVPTECIPFGQSLSINFADDSAWRSAITGITVDGNLLNSGQYTVGPGNININASVLITTGSHIIAVQATGYNNASVIQNITALTAPVLTASTNNNFIGQPVNLNFKDDPVWRENINGIAANGNDLSPDQYTVNAGNIILATHAFPTVGDFKIVVKASGYNEAIVNLVMLPDIVYTMHTCTGTGVAGYSGDGEAATGAQLNNPGGIAIDSLGNVYFADVGNSCIRMVDNGTGIISTIAGNGTSGYSGDGGLATAAQLNSPVDVAIDSTDNIYIDDWGNHRIRMVNKVTGIISTVAGNGTPGYSGDGGAATDAQLMYPCGVTIDSIGNIYIADSKNRIRMVNKTTGTITTLAGNGTNGYSGDGGAATSAQLKYQELTQLFTPSPWGVTIDSSGDLYIADMHNNRIRKVTKASNIITTIAGTGVQFYSGDGGSAVTAQLNNPSDVTFDSEGNIYIVDTSNHCIRKIDKLTGIITTIAGSGFAGGYSEDGGAAIATRLDSLNSIAVDNSGNIYISDPENNRIRKLSVTSKLTAPALTAGINNIVGQPVDLTFTDDADWRRAITSVTVDGSEISSNQYTLTSGCITIADGVLTRIGSHTIIIKASGYFDTAVTQKMVSLIVTMAVSNPSSTGFALSFNLALADLTMSNFVLLDDSKKPVTISAATTTDGGTTYVISAALSAGTYMVSVTDTNYTFGSPQFVIVSAASLIPPVLNVTPLDLGLNLTFTDDVAWRSLISKVTCDGMVFNSSLYTVTAGNININYSKFTSVGTHTFVISATGYRDATAMLINSINYNSTAISDFDFSLNPIYSDLPTVTVRKHGTFTNTVFGDYEGIEPVSLWLTETADGKYFYRFSTPAMLYPLDGSFLEFIPATPGEVVIKIYSRPRVSVTDMAGIKVIFHNYTDLVPLVQIGGDDLVMSRVNSIVANKGQYYPGGSDTPPALTADTKNYTVGESINLTFSDDIAWRAAISSISLDGKELKTCPYSITAGNINIAAGVLTSAGEHTITIKAMGYNDATITQNMEALLIPPTLTPITNNFLGQLVDITFMDDAIWRSAISSFSVDGTVLDSSQYTVTAGNINISSEVFTSAGDHTITIKATGYEDATVTQTMEAPSSSLTATSVAKVGINPDNNAGIIVGLQNITDSNESTSSNPSLQGYQAEIDFDPLKVNIFSANALTTLGNFQIDHQDGKVIISDSTSGTAIQTNMDELFFVSLNLIGTAKDSTGVTVKFSSVTDQNGDNITISQPATLNFQRGKILNDGTTQISLADAVAGLKYLAKLQDESQINVVNMALILPPEDGVTSNKPSVKDVIALMQKLVGLRDDSFNLFVGPLIRIESCQIAPGDTSVVAITGQNIASPGLAGYKISVQYDLQKLEVIGLEKSSSDAFSMQLPNLDTPGTVKISALHTNGVSGNFTLSRLRIKAKENATGSSDLRLTINELVLEDLKPLEVQTIDGNVDLTANQDSQTVSPLTISFVSLPTAVINQPYNYTLSANNGKLPYVWSATGLPDGLTINPQTGEISGIPTSLAESSFVQVSVSDSQSPTQTVSAQLVLEVAGYDM